MNKKGVRYCKIIDVRPAQVQQFHNLKRKVYNRNVTIVSTVPGECYVAVDETCSRECKIYVVYFNVYASTH